jgi:hypothetical protein
MGPRRPSAPAGRGQVTERPLSDTAGAATAIIDQVLMPMPISSAGRLADVARE